MAIFKLHRINEKLRNPKQTAKDILLLNEFNGSGIFVAILNKIVDNDMLYNLYDSFQRGKHRSNILR